LKAQYGKLQPSITGIFAEALIAATLYDEVERCFVRQSARSNTAVAQLLPIRGGLILQTSRPPSVF
jgi:hypothetical protein